MVWLRGDSYRKTIANARHSDYSLLACNVTGDSVIRAMIEAADKKDSDIILQISASAAKFASGDKQDMYEGLRILSDTIKNIAKLYAIGVAIHIDHAKPEHLDFAKFAINNNLVSSVMIDYSAEPYEVNVNTTKEIVKLAHSKDVLVEAELGVLAGKEDDVFAKESQYTNPEQALDFVKQTEVDLFACAIGTGHGSTSQSAYATLRIDILESINNILLKNNFNTGLVMHGGSGLSKEQITECIKRGIVKINKDTQFQMAFSKAVNEYWQKNSDAITTKLDKKRFDPRVWLKAGEDSMQKTCEELIDSVKSNDKSVC